MEANKNNQFSMTTNTVTVDIGQSEKAIILDTSNHPTSKGVVVIPTMHGVAANINVYIKSQSNSSGEWVITFGLSDPVTHATGFQIAYVAYSSTV